MKKVIRKSYWIIAVAVFINSCSKPRDYSEQDVVLEWAKMATYITQFTPANSPTFASRGFGYIGLTMYESVVHGFENNNSLQGQLNGLDELPQPENDKAYSWELSLNAGQA
ncbi:MAG: phosphoesterase, partial [Allomuricauda sp.]